MPLISLFIMGIVIFAVYYLLFMLVIKLQELNRQEFYEFPMGGRLSVVADKLHLLKH